jgi:uncharacterized protein (TIGR03032 family)
MADAPQRPAPAPFQMNFTPALPELMRKLSCTIALTTYQAGKLVLISAVDDERLVQLPRTFQRPMALHARGGALVLSTASTVELFVNDPRMAPSYPKQEKTYDGLYLPRRTYQTGRIDTHGLEWDESGVLWMVNTRFGCLATVSERFSFEPQWSPPFVSDLVHEDRCHLNGMAFKDGAPRYVTCLSQTDEREGWRKNLPNEGVLVNVSTNEIVLDGLAMPHSPRFVGDKLYMLLSATGELVRVNTSDKTYEVVQKIGGFVRGLSYYRDHLFIAFSKLRKNSSTFRNLPIADEATTAGVAVVHEPTGAFVGRLVYGQSVDEIFDVAVLPELVRPGIVGVDREERSLGITMPTKTYWMRRQLDDQTGRQEAAQNGLQTDTGLDAYSAQYRPGPSESNLTPPPESSAGDQGTK